MSYPTEVPVVIVGGGPTGVAAATLLAQHGVEALVLDRWAGVYPQPRAVAADDEVVRILARLGIGDEFAQLSRAGLGLRLVDSNLKVMAEFRRRPTGGPNGFPESNMFDQPELEALMRTNLRRHPSARFIGDAEVTRIAAGPDRVTVEVTDRVDGTRHVIEAAYVLGCDGANSLTRRAIGATMQDLGFEQRWLVIDIDTDADLAQWDGVHQVCSSVRAATFMRVGDTRYRWEFQLLPGETETDFAGLPDIADLIAPWVTPAAVDQLKLVRTCEYTFRAQVANTWRDRRVFLLGDAAHLTPPFIGQGMGAGLRDAMNLAWKLAAVLTGTLPENALESYQQERKRHARTMITYAVRVGQAMTAGGRFGDLVRRRAIPVMKPLISLTEASATPPLRSSALVIGRRAGGLCPNPLLAGQQRFDDVVGNRMAVVTRGSVTATQQKMWSGRGIAVVEAAAGDELDCWLRRTHAQAALVRPDRTVWRTARDISELSF